MVSAAATPLGLLLDDLPVENAEYVGAVPASEIPGELTNSDILLQASRYEPFALTVAEALAAGLPVVASSEVGAIEGVERSVVAEVAPGDSAGMATAIAVLLEGLRTSPAKMRATAQSEAERLFAPEVVCKQISRALEQLVDSRGGDFSTNARMTSPLPPEDPPAVAVGTAHRYTPGP